MLCLLSRTADDRLQQEGRKANETGHATCCALFLLLFLGPPTLTIDRQSHLTKKSNAIRNTLKGSKRILMVDNSLFEGWNIEIPTLGRNGSV